jgi:RHS repeat-associated protein
VAMQVNTYKLWDIAGQTIDHWGNEKSYVAINATPAPFTWWSGSTEPSASDGWQLTDKVIAVNGQGQILESVDALGRPSVAVYDDSEIYTLASFANADFDDGVLYTSFETYQTNVWSLTGGSSGALITTDAFIGKRCYQVDPPGGGGASMLSHIIEALADPEQLYCFNLWYKTPNGDNEVELVIDAVGAIDALRMTLQGTNGTWVPYQWVADLNELGISGPAEVTLEIGLLSGAAGYVRFDQIVFAPVSSRFAASVYDPVKLRKVGAVSVNSNSRQALYNLWDLSFCQIGTSGQPGGLVAGFTVRQLASFDPLTDPFPASNPNKSLGFGGQKEGCYDQFRSDETLEHYLAVDGLISDWNVADNALTLTTVSGMGDLGSVLERDNFTASSLAIYAQVNTPTSPSDTNPSQTMSLGIGAFMVQWDGNLAQWDLLQESGGSYSSVASSTTIDWQPEWLIVIFETRLFFYANGIEVFNYKDADVASSAPHPVQLAGKDTGVSFKNLVALEDIQMGFGYHDGIGRSLQSFVVENADSAIMSTCVYDNLGRPAIQVLPSRIQTGDPGVSDPFAYFDGYITNGGMSGSVWYGNPMTGPVVDTYHTDAGGYPFSRVVYEKSPLSRPLISGQPGVNFAITGNNGLLNPHVTTYNYGINDGSEEFLFALPEGEYFKVTVKDPDGNQAISYQSTSGQAVGTVLVPSNSSLGHTIKYSQVYDLTGRPIASIPASYYEGNINPQTGVIPPDASLIAYDFLSNVTSLTYPDSGTIKAVYDKIGRPRFLQDANGANAGVDEYFYYTKYDELGRPTEQGRYAGSWSDATSAHANDPSWPTTSTTIIQDEWYDGDTNTPNMVGRTWRTTSYNGDISDNAEITHTASYSPTGLTTAFTRELTLNGTPLGPETQDFTYGAKGRLLSQRDSICELRTDYSYNMLGQLIQTKVTETPLTPPNNSVKALYEYNQLGQLSSVIPYKRDNTVLTSKDYTYLPNSWLKETNDGFIDQELKYLEGNCETPASGYYNGALAHNEVTYSGSGITPPTSDYCYTADYMRRVLKANNAGGNQYQWTFDDNSNLLTYTTGSDTHTYAYAGTINRLTQILSNSTTFERNYNYDYNGNVVEVSDDLATRLAITYNRTNGKARFIDNAAVNTEATFDYAPDQSRVRKRVTNNGTPFFTSTFPLPNVEVLSGGGPTQTKAYLDTQGVGLFYHQEGGTFNWVLPDHLGSTRMIIDENGAPKWVFNYDVYGVPSPPTPYNTPAFTFNNLFTGQYFDSELGLYNYKARFYDPSIARFLMVDPAHQGFSPYAYVGGMPNIATDPSGRIAFLLGMLGAAIIGAGIGLVGDLVYQCFMLAFGGQKTLDGDELFDSFVIGAMSGMLAFGLGAVLNGVAGMIFSQGLSKLASAGLGYVIGAASDFGAGYAAPRLYMLMRGQCPEAGFNTGDWVNLGFSLTLGGAAGAHYGYKAGFDTSITDKATFTTRFRAAVDDERIRLIDDAPPSVELKDVRVVRNFLQRYKANTKRGWKGSHEALNRANIDEWRARGVSARAVRDISVDTGEIELFEGNQWKEHNSSGGHGEYNTDVLEGVEGPEDVTSFLLDAAGTRFRRSGTPSRRGPDHQDRAPSYNQFHAQYIRERHWTEFFDGLFNIAYGRSGRAIPLWRKPWLW